MIHARLRAILADVLGVDPSGVGDDTTADAVRGWDSVRHLQLVLAVESEFAVTFAPDEIPTLISARALQQALAARGVLS